MEEPGAAAPGRRRARGRAIVHSHAEPGLALAPAPARAAGAHGHGAPAPSGELGVRIEDIDDSVRLVAEAHGVLRDAMRRGDEALRDEIRALEIEQRLLAKRLAALEASGGRP